MEVVWVKLTAYSETDPFGYKEFPDFVKDVWALMSSNRKFFTQVYEITDEFTIISWGSLSEIPSEKIDCIRDRSYYSGHLSVFYKINSRETIDKLVKLWPYKNIIQYSSENIRMDTKHKEIIDALLKNLHVDEVLIGFAHDADPMYLIGSNILMGKLGLS